MKNKIGWCDMTWNPVWGCLNKCEYCYARKIAKRFAEFIAEYEIDEIYDGSIDGNSIISFYNEKKEDIEDFIPMFLHSQFKKKFPKKPQRIFVGSMSEIYYWEKEWVEKILEKVKQYPQHTFIFLTKFPVVYCKYIFPENCWLGVTITDNNEAYFLDNIYMNENDNRIKFICIEPILSDINPYFFKKGFDWVIAGAETGSKKGKMIIKERWIKNIISGCIKFNIPVYLKDSLKGIYPVEIKEFPKEEK